MKARTLSKLVAVTVWAVWVLRSSARAETLEKRHIVYGELLGKGSLWGLGYDYHLRPWLTVGGLGSFFILRGEKVFTGGPYVGVYPLGLGRHRLFAHAGPYIVHKITPAAVPELPDRTDTGVAGQVCLGYEYRRGIVIRGFVMATAGSGGFYPWLGLSLGWSL